MFSWSDPTVTTVASAALALPMVALGTLLQVGSREWVGGWVGSRG